MKNKEKTLEEKVDELYDWYKRSKFLLTISILATIFALVILGTLLVVMGMNWLYESFGQIWIQVSIDTKFVIFVTIVIFILGILVGRMKR